MNDRNTQTIKECSKFLNISVSSVYRLIRNKRLNAKIEDGKQEILNDELLSKYFKENIMINKQRKPTTYFPDELIGYKNWHETLDYFSWLLKVSYSNPNEIKKKQFNIRTIFENYLNYHKICVKSIKSSFLVNIENYSLIRDDIKRGWYNELSFLYPLKKATLGISFREINENIKISSTRFAFPSWKITECYYSSFFYFRSVSFLINPNFRIQEHKATLNSFKNNALGSLKKQLWKFPFDIEYHPHRKFISSKTILKDLKYINYQYCAHPKYPDCSPNSIVKGIYSEFKKRGHRFNKQNHYTLFDFLFEFRIWANYLDIDNLLNFWGKGYKGYLDQNLSLLLFFIGGIAELVYISTYGEQAYLNELQSIYDLFAANNKDIKDNFVYSSVYQRMKIYKIRKIISSEIKIEIKDNQNEIF